MTRSEIETLFKTYYTQMYGVARAILYDEDTAKDVVSDVFATLINNQTVLQADTVEHYLMSSTRNRCLNVIAHKKIFQIRQQHLCPLLRLLHLQIFRHTKDMSLQTPHQNRSQKDIPFDRCII